MRKAATILAGTMLAASLIASSVAFADTWMSDFKSNARRLAMYGESAGRCNTTMEISGLTYVQDSEDCMRIFNNGEDIVQLQQRFQADLEELEARMEGMSSAQKNSSMRAAKRAAAAFESISEALERAEFLIETRQ